MTPKQQAARIEDLEREITYLLDAVIQAKPHVRDAMKNRDDSWIWPQLQKLTELMAGVNKSDRTLP